MTYGEFKAEAKKSELAKILLNMFYKGVLPLYPAIELFEKYKQAKPAQLSLF